MESIEARVAKGAAALDKVMPGWESKIDLSILDLGDGCRCVLGQLFGEKATLEYQHANGWWYALKHFGIGYSPEGFNVATEKARLVEFAALDEAWISLIKERHDSGALSGL